MKRETKAPKKPIPPPNDARFRLALGLRYLVPPMEMRSAEIALERVAVDDETHSFFEEARVPKALCDFFEEHSYDVSILFGSSTYAATNELRQACFVPETIERCLSERLLVVGETIGGDPIVLDLDDEGRAGVVEHELFYGPEEDRESARDCVFMSPFDHGTSVLGDVLYALVFAAKHGGLELQSAQELGAALSAIVREHEAADKKRGGYGDVSDAGCWMRCLERLITFVESREAQASVHEDAAWAAFQEGDFTRAESECEAVLKLGVSDKVLTRMLEQYAWVALARGNLAKAKARSERIPSHKLPSDTFELTLALLEGDAAMVLEREATLDPQFYESYWPPVLRAWGSDGALVKRFLAPKLAKSLPREVVERLLSQVRANGGDAIAARFPE